MLRVILALTVAVEGGVTGYIGTHRRVGVALQVISTLTVALRVALRVISALTVAVEGGVTGYIDTYRRVEGGVTGYIGTYRRR